MRIGGSILLVLLVVVGATVVLTGARECDMQAQGMTIRVRATGEDITEKAGAYARTCLARAFRGDMARDSTEPRPRSVRNL